VYLYIDIASANKVRDTRIRYYLLSEVAFVLLVMFVDISAVVLIFSYHHPLTLLLFLCRRLSRCNIALRIGLTLFATITVIDYRIIPIIIIIIIIIIVIIICVKYEGKELRRTLLSYRGVERRSARDIDILACDVNDLLMYPRAIESH